MKVQFTKNDLKNMGKRCIRLPYADSITNDCQKVGLQEIEVTLNVRILLANKDMDSATYQEMFNLLKELNS